MCFLELFNNCCYFWIKKRCSEPTTWSTSLPSHTKFLGL